MIKILRQNIQYICKLWLRLIGGFATSVTILSVLISWDDVHIEKPCVKVGCLSIILLLLLLISILRSLDARRKKVIFRCASGRIIVRYSDLLKESFNKRNKRKKLYVIPVNSSFDTIVDTDISLCDKPLISPNTLHGKWIQKMQEHGISPSDIDNAIHDCLNAQKKSPRGELPEKVRGKQDIYDLGTIAVVKGVGENAFLLLALTDFDENNNAHVSIENLEQAIKSLIDFYDLHGQGHELVIPLMGTNFSRTGLTHRDTLHIIATKFQIYKNKIHGDVSIVIRKEDRDKVSIDMCEYKVIA